MNTINQQVRVNTSTTAPEGETYRYLITEERLDTIEFKVGDLVKRVRGTNGKHKEGTIDRVKSLSPSGKYKGFYSENNGNCWNAAEYYVLVDAVSITTSDTVVDVVNHPSHYTKHPSGVECITITEHMGFNLGNAVKYIWRADLKNDAVEDLKKAAWYINREISKRG
jgi:hypothetical protein